MRSSIAIGLFCLVACSLWGQESERLELNFQNERLDRAIKAIRKASDVRFAYNGKLLRQYNVTADLRGMEVLPGVQRLLENTGLQVEQIGGTLAILVRVEDAIVAPLEVRSNLTWHSRVVDDETGESLPFASIRIPSLDRAVRSNEEGYFLLTDIPSDTVSISISYIGFSTRTVQLSAWPEQLPKSVTLIRNLSVLPLVPVYGEQTRMVQRGENPGQSVLDASSVRYIPGVGEPDIMRSLQFLPGIGATRESSGNIHIRGGASDENLVMYDGFTVYHVDHFFGIISAFNPESVKHVQVHRGWFEPQYGGRTAGMIQLTGKDGNKRQASGTLNANLLSANVQIESPLPFRESSFILSARRSITDVVSTPVYQELFNNLYSATLADDLEVVDVFQTSAPDFRFSDLSMRISVQPRPSDEVNFSLYSGNDRLQYDYFLQTSDEDAVEFLDDAAWGNLGVSGKWSRDVAGRNYLSSLVSYSRFNSDLFAVDRTFLDGIQVDSLIRDGQTQLEEAAFRQHLEHRHGPHEISTGLWWTYQRNRFSSRSTDAALSRLAEQAHTVAIYAQDHIQPHPRLDLMLGSRMTLYSGTNTLYAAPRGAISFHLTSRWMVKGAAGRFHQYIRRLRRQDLQLNSPDTWRLANLNDIPVQQADQFLLGLAYDSKGWSFEVEGYYRFLEGVVLDSELEGLNGYAGIDAPYLNGTGDVLGVDIQLGRTVGKHTGWLAATVARSDQRFDELDQSFVLTPYQPLTEIKGVYVLRLPKWRFTWTGVYGSGTPFTKALGAFPVDLINGETQTIVAFGDINGGRLPEYHRMDVSLHYFLTGQSSNAEIGVSVYNLYNRLNVADRRYFISGDDLGVRDLQYLGLIASISLRLEF